MHLDACPARAGGQSLRRPPLLGDTWFASDGHHAAEATSSHRDS
jgi:hypothetical protein